MRVIFLNKPLTILLVFIVWGVFQVLAALICLNLPDRFFNPDGWFFKSHKFEKQGQIYQSFFLVNRWKHLLPDGGAAWGGKGFEKKKLRNRSQDYLQEFLMESARGEMTHWLAILPFWVFGFFTPFNTIWMMLAYSLVANLPCIIVQRYNRPRIQRLLMQMKRRP